jgi:hypothetical protein
MSQRKEVYKYYRNTGGKIKTRNRFVKGLLVREG